MNKFRNESFALMLKETSLIFRLFLIMLIVIVSFYDVIYAIPIISIATGIAYYRYKEKLEIQKIDILVLMILIFETVSYYTSINKTNTYLNLLHVLLFILIFYYLRIVILKIEGRSHFLWIAVLGFVISLISIALFGQFFSSLYRKNLLPIINYRYQFNPFGFSNNEWTSILLCFFSLMIVGYFIVSNKKIKLFFIIGMMLNATAVLYSFSRGAYMAIAVCFVVNIAGYLYLKIGTPAYLARRLVVPIIGVIIFVIPFFTSFGHTLFVNSTMSQQRSAESRLIVWENSLAIMRENFITGVGSGNFSLYYEKYSQTGIFTRSQNLAVQMLVEKGIIGTALYLALLIILAFKTFEVVKSSLFNKRQMMTSIAVFSVLLTTIVKDLTFSAIFSNDLLLVLMSVTVAFIVQSKNFLYEVGQSTRVIK